MAWYGVINGVVEVVVDVVAKEEVLIGSGGKDDTSTVLCRPYLSVGCASLAV